MKAETSPTSAGWRSPRAPPSNIFEEHFENRRKTLSNEKHIWHAKPVTARRHLQRMKIIFKTAILKEQREKAILLERLQISLLSPTPLNGTATSVYAA